MSTINRRISASLANGAEYLAMGEIAAHHNLLGVRCVPKIATQDSRTSVYYGESGTIGSRIL